MTDKSRNRVGNWYHIAAIYGASTAAMKIYLDGSHKNANTTTAAPIDDDQLPLRIGSDDTRRFFPRPTRRGRHLRPRLLTMPAPAGLQLLGVAVSDAMVIPEHCTTGILVLGGLIGLLRRTRKGARSP